MASWRDASNRGLRPALSINAFVEFIGQQGEHVELGSEPVPFRFATVHITLQEPGRIAAISSPLLSVASQPICRIRG
jgi:hypothetical protein